MRRLGIIITALVLLLSVAAPVSAQEPDEGVITGLVVNATPGGGSVAGVEVTLLTYVEDILADQTTVATDAAGNFAFAGIDTVNDYIVFARYLGVDYYYPVTFEGSEAYVEVGVCEVTDSDEFIRVGVAHTVIDVDADSFYVTELYWLVNDGDTTYTGDDGVLVFTLPEGAYDFEAPEQLMLDFEARPGNRVAYLVAFPPGERQLVYSYRLPRTGANDLTISLTVDYPADSLEIMVGGEDIEVSVTRLAPADPLTAEDGTRYIHFQGENLSRGVIIDLYLSGLSPGGFPYYIIGIIAAVVLGIIGLTLLRRQKRKGGGE